MKKNLFVAIIGILTVVSCGKDNNVVPEQPQEPEQETFVPVFSISENEKVQFSPGNLQFQPSGYIWRFADNQYDMIGSANTNISISYSGWIDLFGWGTSGRHDYADPNNICYAPTSYRKTYDHDNNYNATGYGPSMNMADINLTGTSAIYDWGVNRSFMHRGATIEGSWRTLSKAEWEYLLELRQCATVSGVPNSRHANVMVNYVRGLLIFPDNYVHPDGVTAINATDINGVRTEYDNTHSTFSVQDWEKMEKAGAVFLPACGFRSGTEVKATNTNGFYWSTTRIDKGKSERIYFQSSYNRFSTTGCNFEGAAVRLVKDYVE